MSSGPRSPSARSRGSPPRHPFSDTRTRRRPRGSTCAIGFGTGARKRRRCSGQREEPSPGDLKPPPRRHEVAAGGLGAPPSGPRHDHLGRFGEAHAPSRPLAEAAGREECELDRREGGWRALQDSVCATGAAGARSTDHRGGQGRHERAERVKWRAPQDSNLRPHGS